jgi:5-methylcytosine-specific restriction endonuclease McrA
LRAPWWASRCEPLGLGLARRCLGCRALIRTGSYYRACTKTTTQRGYGYVHQQRARATIAASPRCAICGSNQNLTADHVVPIANGGADGPLGVVCRTFNSRRGNEG